MTDIIVTICMNLRNTLSGRSFTIRMPMIAPMPMTGSINRFNIRESHVMLSHTNAWSGTFNRLTTRKNHALMPMYFIFSFLMESK